MNYKLHYEKLIAKHGLQKRPVNAIGFERHHILPKSLGGDNSQTNLIYLTARQHVFAHWLLFKIHKNSKMAMAFFMMRANRSHYLLNNNEEKSAIVAMQAFGLMTRAVKTPNGIFNSYRDAANSHNIPESTFQDILRRGTEGFIDLGSMRKIVAASKGSHGMSRRIKTPLGYFPYVGAASAAHSVNNKTIARRCNENPDEYYYLDPPKQQRIGEKSKNAKRVVTPFGIYASTMEAAIALGISRDTLRYKIKSEHIKNYYFE
jgi:hypothetical protein